VGFFTKVKPELTRVLTAVTTGQPKNAPIKTETVEQRLFKIVIRQHTFAKFRLVPLSTASLKQLCQSFQQYHLRLSEIKGFALNLFLIKYGY
jgi:hypothetical protein